MKNETEIKSMAIVEYGNDPNLFGGQRDGFLKGFQAANNEINIHHEAIIDCCTKLLKTIDEGKIPKMAIMGLRILLKKA